MSRMRAWKFRPGSSEEVLGHLIARCVVCLDYGISDLNVTMDRRELIALLRSHNPGRSDKGMIAHAGQINTLFHKVMEGDLALVPIERGKFIMIGEVKSETPDISKTTIEIKVNWLALRVPICCFEQDLQYSFMAIHKFCEVARNGAAGRILKIAQGGQDPGY